jgi:hypothetical protein
VPAIAVPPIGLIVKLIGELESLILKVLLCKLLILVQFHFHEYRTERTAETLFAPLSLSAISPVAVAVLRLIAGSDGFVTVAIAVSVFSNNRSSTTVTLRLPKGFHKES